MDWYKDCTALSSRDPEMTPPLIQALIALSLIPSSLVILYGTRTEMNIDVRGSLRWLGRWEGMRRWTVLKAKRGLDRLKKRFILLLFFLFAFPSICVYTFVCFFKSIFFSSRLFIYVFMYLFIYWFIHSFIYLFIQLFIIYSSFHIFFHLFINITFLSIKSFIY